MRDGDQKICEALLSAMQAMRAPIDGWKGELERTALTKIRALLEDWDRIWSKDWQAIDTAPSDVVVLLYSPPSSPYDSGVFEVRIHHDSRCGSRHGWATHWMPLPPPPSLAADHGDKKCA